MENAMNWTKQDSTKTGLCTISIGQEGDLFEAKLEIDTFCEKGIFSSEKEAFIWLYGVKQWLNDKVASYKEEIIDGKPSYNKYDSKKKLVDSIKSKAELLKIAISAYENFSLSKQAEKSDKVSLSSIEHTLSGVLDAATLARVTEALKRK